MNKYVVAFYSNFDGSMLMEEVTAISRVAAGIRFLELEPEHAAAITTYDQLQQQAFDLDHAIGVIQIDKKNWKHYTTQGPDHVAPAFH